MNKANQKQLHKELCTCKAFVRDYYHLFNLYFLNQRRRQQFFFYVEFVRK